MDAEAKTNVLKCSGCGADVGENSQFCGQCGASVGATPGGLGDLAEGTVLDKQFVVVSQLGKGGMGTVYVGRDTRLNR